jgi:hypothetical protein
MRGGPLKHERSTPESAQYSPSSMQLIAVSDAQPLAEEIELSKNERTMADRT